MLKTEAFERIYRIYCEQYPHLANAKHGNWKKVFADNALMLAAPKGISIADVCYLAEISAGGIHMDE